MYRRLSLADPIPKIIPAFYPYVITSLLCHAICKFHTDRFVIGKYFVVRNLFHVYDKWDIRLSVHVSKIKTMLIHSQIK